MSRYTLVACFLAFAAGCDMEPMEKRNSGPVAPGGIAIPAVEGPSSAAGAGAQPTAPATEMAETPPAEKKPNKGIIGKTSNVVVDANKALQDPEIVLAEGASADGVDPFSQAGSVYFSAMAKVSTLGMQQAVNMKKGVEGRYPTYDEYMQMMKENNIEFVKLRSYEMYGYDDKTGKILVLMDKRLQREHFKRAGIDPPAE
ncbi:hypothetical protein M4951_06830 [Blastopirellula sp. J2-11]|uniref:hypothetical protein n=1 Tax=Blastopirellula sp. J2-11 TaxID=2943192 RepID=UPI0021C75A95|nr:hypothetical protein [Blastopirellula sp. J2-11]UUO08025.1 hypothetical protein M4951_06830 [Blastopirellula sp. J2-11]